jgi:hypothetical protein
MAAFWGEFVRGQSRTLHDSPGVIEVASVGNAQSSVHGHPRAAAVIPGPKRLYVLSTAVFLPSQTHPCIAG